MVTRPKTLAEVAWQTDCLEAFRRNMREWLHEVRSFSSRAQAEDAVRSEPVLLRGQFKGGEIADAWLGAYAEHLCLVARATPPVWAFEPSRFSQEPYFVSGSTDSASRIVAMRDSPLSFKRRNLYTLSVELPFAVRPGRPAKTPAEKRQNNRERQRRFQEKRRTEYAHLRRLVGERNTWAANDFSSVIGGGPVAHPESGVGK
jgi:hypothetical protein